MLRCLIMGGSFVLIRAQEQRKKQFIVCIWVNITLYGKRNDNVISVK